MEISIIPVNPEDFIPRHVPPYVEIANELEVLEDHFEASTHEKIMPVLFEGPPGVGKTLCFAEFARRKKCPIIQADLAEDTRRTNLIGKFVVIGDKIYFSLGVLPTAIEVANAYGAAVLVLEEISACPPRIQKLLNQLLDWRFHVYVDEIGRVFKLREGAKLLIGATTNPTIWAGTGELNPDLRSRFYVVNFGFPPREKELEILKVYGVKDEWLADKLVVLANETRAAAARYQIAMGLSPRDLVQAATAYEAYAAGGMNSNDALVAALRHAILWKYENEEDRKFVSQRIESLFGISV